MISITSSANKKYKYFKSLQLKKTRCEYGEYCVEGIKSVRDAISSERLVSAVIVSDKFREEMDFGGAEVYVAEELLFNKLSDTKTPQGIMAVIKMTDCGGFMPKNDSAYVYCDGVRDPGNMGTIIRTADAAGFKGVITSKDCVDIYAPKVVRASMGSFFKIDLITDKSPEDLAKYKAMGFSLTGGALREDSADYRAADYKKSSIIIVGNESNGISEAVLELCAHVKIPIYGGAESLNASVAAGILMYEWARNNKA